MRLVTERLLLRPWTDADRDSFAAMVGDPEVMRFYTATRDRAAADAWIDKMIAGLAACTSHFLAVERREDQAFVGMVGTADIPHVLPGNPKVEVGWILDKPHWGRGYAPEAAAAAIAHGFATLDVPEIVAFTATINTPSQRVMEKLGMVRRPEDDFDHPSVPEGHRLRRHVLYRLARP